MYWTVKVIHNWSLQVGSILQVIFFILQPWNEFQQWFHFVAKCHAIRAPKISCICFQNNSSRFCCTDNTLKLLRLLCRSSATSASRKRILPPRSQLEHKWYARGRVTHYIRLCWETFRCLRICNYITFHCQKRIDFANPSYMCRKELQNCHWLGYHICICGSYPSGSCLVLWVSYRFQHGPQYHKYVAYMSGYFLIMYGAIVFAYVILLSLMVRLTRRRQRLFDSMDSGARTLNSNAATIPLTPRSVPNNAVAPLDVPPMPSTFRESPTTPQLSRERARVEHSVTGTFVHPQYPMTNRTYRQHTRAIITVAVIFSVMTDRLLSSIFYHKRYDSDTWWFYTFHSISGILHVRVVAKCCCQPFYLLATGRF